MKLLFVDEFKDDKHSFKFYGLCAVLIDNSSYSRFKKGFYKRLEALGWDPGIEIKGRYSFSIKNGDTNIPIPERLKFVENLFELSKSSGEKYASAKVYFAFDFFPNTLNESNIYIDLLARILKRLPNGIKSGNKNGKNNICIFLDNNNSVNIKNVSEQSDFILCSKNLFLIERCVSLNSGNETPGIIFADHVAYFIQNLIKTSDFNDSNKECFKALMNRFSGGIITPSEQIQLDNFLISLDKEQKSANLLKALKIMTYSK